MYAMALIRGINGLADIMQQQRSFAGSVASLCAELGLPGWLVDLRHDASHNDLPSLPTLRLAAQTFLSFLGERFWKPLHESHTGQRQQAYKILLEYEAATNKVGDGTDSEVAQVMQDPHEAIEDDDDESSDEEFGEDSNELDVLLGMNSGKTMNRFAALEERKKQKVKHPKRRRRKVILAPTNPLDIARQYVKIMPMDVGLYVALSFLIWGATGDVPLGCGALVPSSATLIPASQVGIDRIRQRYKPLLFALAQAWPGFVHSFTVHLVNCCLSIEATGDITDVGAVRKLYFLTSWIRFSLSRDFHRCHDRYLSIINGSLELGKRAVSIWKLTERKFMEQPAPLETLRAANLPLNSLCDRCLDFKGTNSQDLASLFAKILGNERILNCGIHHGIFPPNSDVAPLEEMNFAMSLVTELEVYEKTSRQSQHATKLLWTQCSSWDSCAIGSLPGRPV
jgi:ribosomal biogenesis protein LAS1